MGAEGGLLEEAGHELVVLDVVDVLLLERALAAPELELGADLGLGRVVLQVGHGAQLSGSVHASGAIENRGNSERLAARNGTVELTDERRPERERRGSERNVGASSSGEEAGRGPHACPDRLKGEDDGGGDRVGIRARRRLVCGSRRGKVPSSAERVWTRPTAPTPRIDYLRRDAHALARTNLNNARLAHDPARILMLLRVSPKSTPLRNYSIHTHRAQLPLEDVTNSVEPKISTEMKETSICSLRSTRATMGAQTIRMCP